MADTAQPATAADPEAVPTREDGLQAAASAFKVELGQEEAPAEQPRKPNGQFASQAGDEEIEATDEADEAEAGAESQDEGEEESEAGDEPQPEETDLPPSWPADKAELWEGLEPDAQAFIRQRDAQQNAAVNAKFMEAANLRQAHEAEIFEAQTNRQRYAEAVDQVLSLVVPQPPPRSMLDYNSSDYDPDAYHYRKAQYEDTVAFLEQHKAQRQTLAAQEQMQRFNAINGTTRDSFIQLVPDVADQAKAPAVFQSLMEYAVSEGAPPELFQTPTTALEWKVLWKAKEYDRLQAAKARVSKEPKPEPKKAQPAVRPGVTTPRSAIEKQKRGKALDRLAREGSVEAGAAVLKHLMKGATR